MNGMSRAMRTAGKILLFVLTMAVASIVLQSGAIAGEGGAEGGHDLNGVYRVGFHVWKPGKIYDEAMLGILDGLKLEGIAHEKVVVHSNRDEKLAVENFRKLDSMDLDLIYSLSSAGTKIARTMELRTPVVATVINHPVSLGIAGEGPREGSRLTGTSYYIDAEKQLEFYLRLYPSTETVGMIYDSNNPAGYLAEEPFMRSACERMGKRFVSIGVTQRSEIAEAALGLIKGGAQLIVIPTNRVLYSNLDAVLGVTHGHKVPVVSMNKQGVEYGALAALFADTYKLGRYTAPMAKKIMLGREDPFDIPFAYAPDPDIIINLKEAKALGYEFPPDILGMAAIILQ